MNGFTQPSYPAIYAMPSDEDYKTPVLVNLRAKIGLFF